jgi:hypothetical protein
MRKCSIAVVLFCAASVAKADFVYTFSRTAANPYSFSFTLPSILTTTTANLGVTPISAGGFTFNDSSLTVTGSDYCFAFGDGTTDASVGPPCGLSNPFGITGITVEFNNPNTVGTFNATSTSSFPDGREINQLIISSTATQVPEPAAVGLLATAICAIGLLLRQRARSGAFRETRVS